MSFFPALTLNGLKCCLNKAIAALGVRIDEVIAAEAWGNATLVAGTVTVADPLVTANSIIVVSRKTAGGTPGTGHVYTLNAGVGFTITATVNTDTSVVSYHIKY